MPPRSEFLTDDSAVSAARTAPEFYGRRPALLLGGGLVLALASMTLLRWVGGPESGSEKVVQEPIAVEAAVSEPAVDLTAPDPGDAAP